MNQDESFSAALDIPSAACKLRAERIPLQKPVRVEELLRFWTLLWRQTLRSNFRGAEMVTPFASFCKPLHTGAGFASDPRHPE